MKSRRADALIWIVADMTTPAKPRYVLQIPRHQNKVKWTDIRSMAKKMSYSQAYRISELNKTFIIEHKDEPCI